MLEMTGMFPVAKVDSNPARNTHMLVKFLGVALFCLKFFWHTFHGELPLSRDIIDLLIYSVIKHRNLSDLVLLWNLDT